MDSQLHPVNLLSDMENILAYLLLVKENRFRKKYDQKISVKVLNSTSRQSLYTFSF